MAEIKIDMVEYCKSGQLPSVALYPVRNSMYPILPHSIAFDQTLSRALCLIRFYLAPRP
jgi:hypothetical protein